MDPRNKHAAEWIEKCLDSEKLTSWESDFVTSLDLQVSADRTLSEKQLDILERIYTERTD